MKSNTKVAFIRTNKYKLWPSQVGFNPIHIILHLSVAKRLVLTVQPKRSDASLEHPEVIIAHALRLHQRQSRFQAWPMGAGIVARTQQTRHEFVGRATTALIVSWSDRRTLRQDCVLLVQQLFGARHVGMRRPPAHHERIVVGEVHRTLRLYDGQTYGPNVRSKSYSAIEQHDGNVVAQLRLGRVLRMQPRGGHISIDVGGSVQRVGDRFEPIDLTETNGFTKMMLFWDLVEEIYWRKQTVNLWCSWPRSGYAVRWSKCPSINTADRLWPLGRSPAERRRAWILQETTQSFMKYLPERKVFYLTPCSILFILVLYFWFGILSTNKLK